VEEPFRLMAVNRDVGGVQVEHNLGQRRGVRFYVELSLMASTKSRKQGQLIEVGEFRAVPGRVIYPTSSQI
jgi:hypothetical protein